MLWEEFNVIMPYCAQGIGLHQETFFQIVLNLNMSETNYLVSDSRNLN